jgi:hypothetical protein
MAPPVRPVVDTIDMPKIDPRENQMNRKYPPQVLTSTLTLKIIHIFQVLPTAQAAICWFHQSISCKLRLTVVP